MWRAVLVLWVFVSGLVLSRSCGVFVRAILVQCPFLFVYCDYKLSQTLLVIKVVVES